MTIESIQNIIDDEKLEIWAVSKQAGDAEIRHNKGADIASTIGHIMRELDNEMVCELISDAMIDNELELAPAICNFLVGESGGFQQQYLSYLIERVLWYLFNCEHYNTSGPGDDLSQSEQEAEWNAQANAMGVRRG